MATIPLSWWVGLALAPTLGTQLLSLSASLTFVICAATAGAAAAAMLALEQLLPCGSRLTPRPAAARAPRHDQFAEGSSGINATTR